MAHPAECLEEDRFTKLEKSHSDTADELKKINLTLMRIETTLSGKVIIYDKHVDDGEKWRGSIMFWLITTMLFATATGAGTALGFGIWVGRLDNQVAVNTKKWENLDQRMGVLIGQSRTGSRDSFSQ